MGTREEYIHKFLIIEECSENFGKILEVRRSKGYDIGIDKAYQSVKDGELFYKTYDIKNDQLLSVQDLEKTREYVFNFRNRLNDILAAIAENIEK